MGELLRVSFLIWVFIAISFKEMRVNNFSLIAQKVSLSQCRKSHNWVNDEKKLEMGDLPELVQSKVTLNEATEYPTEP